MSSRKTLANAIRMLSVDAVQRANSGHPGAPMGMADIAEVLWRDFLNHNPNNPAWANRDRFVLSNGHGSMLLYSLLHLTGYDLPIDELKNFRQLHSKTPGHPEVGYTAGIETTTGPLGEAEVAATREALDWPYPPFVIPTEIASQWDARKSGQAKEAAWNQQFATYAKAFPELADEFTRRVNGQLPADFASKAQAFIEKLQAKPAKIASRKASQNAIEAFGPLLPEFLGGSADLAPSNLTLWSGSKAINEDSAGNYIHYGVREFGMTAIANGIALHGGFLPYTSTFLMFVEYARNAVRMAALMKQRQVMVYTHDSIGLGEDGPTHQPVEQIASLRMTPNLSTWRPCDQVESAVAWKYGVERQDGPTALIFSRQNLTQQERTWQQVQDIARGGYVLKNCEGQPQLILISTGSEVELAVAAWQQLTAEGVKARVVSMPSTDVFDKQDAAYREAVLPQAVSARIAVEAGIADYWFKYVGLNGAIIGMQTYGESAPAEQLYQEFGITVEVVLQQAKALLA